jgi:SAM-dependent methyltransferase
MNEHATTTTGIRSWAFDDEMTSPFALPRGFVGRLAGAVMGYTNASEQRDAAQFLAVRPGERVIEIGYGPGTLVKMLAAAGAAEVGGVDPSPEMQAMARRRARRAKARADLRVGTADAIDFEDARFDAAVSVNNVLMWTDLGAALDEIRRVLRPGGRVVIAWHGGRAPTRIGRTLVPGPEILDRIEQAVQDRFDTAERRELQRLTAFSGTRSSG